MPAIVASRRRYLWSLERIPEGLRSETSAPIAILDAKFSLVVRERVTRCPSRICARRGGTVATLA
jgi:hypothetical protein